MCRVVEQLPPFSFGGHSPTISPVDRSRVVLRQQGGQVVGEAIIAIAGVVAVLGERVVVAVAILVSAPVVGALGRGLAPGEVVAVFLGRVCTHIAGGP